MPEHERFLDWLLTRLAELRPDLLIVAGDVFDHANPPQEAVRQYNAFLARLRHHVGCRVLVLGGNHDSPAVLEASQEPFEFLNVTVLGAAPEDASAALLELPEVVVCAVPFLRERDVRRSVAGQTGDEIASAIRKGIVEHYRKVHTAACELAGGRPILATGHLTSVGSIGSESERSIHIGNLGAVGANCFTGFIYTALGHIHKPQAVGEQEHIRYAGTPIPLDFSEVGTPKEIRVVEITDGELRHRAEPVPVFRELLRCKTTAAELPTVLQAAAQPDAELVPWVELNVTDGRQHPDLQRKVEEAVQSLALQVLKIVTPEVERALDEAAQEKQLLSELRPEEVFDELLRYHQIEEESEQAGLLRHTFVELLESVQQGTETSHA